MTWYASFDIEADGQNPLRHSMLSLGICVVDGEGVVQRELSLNILARPDAEEDPDTMEWWSQFPEAWEECQKGAVTPTVAMALLAVQYTQWSAEARVVWVAMPAAWDWMFLKSYYDVFAPPGSPDIGHKALCISTLRKYIVRVNGIAPAEYDALVAEWTGGREGEVHTALPDARHQAAIFTGLYNYAPPNAPTVRDGYSTDTLVAFMWFMCLSAIIIAGWWGA